MHKKRSKRKDRDGKYSLIKYVQLYGNRTVAYMENVAIKHHNIQYLIQIHCNYNTNLTVLALE